MIFVEFWIDWGKIKIFVRFFFYFSSHHSLFRQFLIPVQYGKPFVYLFRVEWNCMQIVHISQSMEMQRLYILTWTAEFDMYATLKQVIDYDFLSYSLSVLMGKFLLWSHCVLLPAGGLWKRPCREKVVITASDYNH